MSNMDDEDPDDDFAASFKKQGAHANPNQACIREGFLKKKSPAGVIRKVWQSRYFKLMPDCMMYSKKKEDKEAQGVIPFTSIGQVTIPKGKGAGRFDVEVVGGAAVRTFCLQAKSEKEAIEWVETLKNLQKNAVRGSPVITKQESTKEVLKGAKSPNNASGNKFWKNAKALTSSRESRLNAISENDGEPPQDSEEAAIKLHVLSQDSSFVGFGDLYFAHDRRHRGSSYIMHAVSKKDKALNSARLLFKDMKDIKHRFIFNQVHTGETTDTIFAMYEPACEKESSLAYHLRTFKKFPEDVVLALGAQLTMALEYIHDSSGSGFWTLSPNKLWFGSDGCIAIKEPLLCLPASEIPKEMMLPSYRSPEHFQGGEGAAADWWRLGLLMYELLTGANPFVKPGITPEAAIPKFKVSELKFPEDVSKNTQDLIKRLMDPNPSTRLGNENDGVEVRDCPYWGLIGKAWDVVGSRSMVSPWLQTHILDPAEQKAKHRDTRPALDKSESIVEVTMLGSRGVTLEEADTGADVTQKKTPKKDKKLPPKLMCKLEFEGQYFSTAAVASVKSQLDWNEKFTFKFRGPVHPSFNIVIQVVDQSKGYGLIVGDITIRLLELKAFDCAAPSWYSILTPDATANGEVQLSVTMSKLEEKAGSAVSHLPKPLSHYFGSELAGAVGGAPPEDNSDDESTGRFHRESKADDEDDGDGSVPKDDTTAMRDTAGNLVHFLHKIREKRSKDPPKRFKNGGYDLDLTYITPKIIAMADPADNSKVGNTNDAVFAFFKQYHHDNYKLYNLNGAKIPADKLASTGGKVYDCPIPDHNVPSFLTLISLVHDAEAHYNAKENSVLAAHCNTGKGRAGTIIACVLLMAGLAETADEALFMFAKKRTPDAIAVTVPSQRRYVHYFEKYLKDYHKVSRPFPVEAKTVTLLRVRLTTLYALEVGGGCDPYFVCISPRNEVLYDHKKASKNMLSEFKGTDTHADLVCIDESDNSPTGCLLYGDIKFIFFDHDKGHQALDTKLFHFWLNPAFISNDYVCLDKVQIDGAQSKLFKSSFRVELFFNGT